MPADGSPDGDAYAPSGAITPGCWFDHAGFPEPTLAQLLDDPLVRLLMKRDGVNPGELRTLLAAVAGSVESRRGGKR